jgi:hypothetical protein
MTGFSVQRACRLIKSSVASVLATGLLLYHHELAITLTVTDDRRSSGGLLESIATN